jgi:hypothetical protein
VLRPDRLRAAAPKLLAAERRAERAAERLAAGRLADRRLEEQRRRAVPHVNAVVDAMRRAARAAGAGNPRQAEAAAQDLARAVAALRSVGAG